MKQSSLMRGARDPSLFDLLNGNENTWYMLFEKAFVSLPIRTRTKLDDKFFIQYGEGLLSPLMYTVQDGLTDALTEE